MPCALTLAMAVKATTASSPLDGALLLFVFGLGTVPAMLVAAVLFARLGQRRRGYLLKGAAAVVILMGLVTLYSGLGFFDVMRKLGN
jgi:sulfite exporter TauE/SafE